jgi:transposase
MFVRRKRNKSGSTSIQIIEKRDGRNVVISSIGCADNEDALLRLEAEAHASLRSLIPQQRLEFDISSREQAAIELLKTGTVKAVGPDLILGKIFDGIGFNKLPEPLFKEIVLARLVYPASKLRTTEYLLQHQGKDIGVDCIYRFLDRLESKYKKQAEEISYTYSKQTLGMLTVVFYDMTTLYFEAESEDDLRKVGFSKDGKFQHPQIMLGLLVGQDGYPLAYDIFEGNTFEGTTLLPILEKAQKRFNLLKPTVVADSALLSKGNIKLLTENGYKFIIGARIKNEACAVREQILKTASALKDNESFVIEKSDGTRLIVDYSEKRAKKDAHNREKGLDRLNKQIGSGKLTKGSLNSRGYNKFLTLEGDVTVTLNQSKVQQDAYWDGLKGYVTNSSHSPKEVIASYRQLWKIEKAFRISKTDLRIRRICNPNCVSE